MGRTTKLDDRQFTLISKALADPKRFKILKRIAQADGPLTCTSVGEWINLAPATVSHHLKELENAGLVNIQRDGKFGYLTLRRDIWNSYLRNLSLF